jgi:outer membrane protein assembly factor BamB
MKKIVCFLFLFLVCFSLLNAQTNKDWKWRINGKDVNNSVFNENVVFLSDKANNIFAFDKNTGRQIWKYSVGKQIQYDLLLQQNNLAVIESETNNVLIIDTQTGTKIREITSASSNFFSRLDEKENILVHTNKGITASNTQSGKEIWSFPGFQTYTGIDFSEDFTILTGIGFAQMLNSKTGELLSSVKRHGEFDYLGENAESFFVTYKGRINQDIYSINKKTNQAKYLSEFDSEVFFHEISDDVLYLSFYNYPRIIAINLETGEYKWEFLEDENLEIRFENLSIYNNFLYLGTDKGILYAFDKTDGNLKWKKSFGSSRLESSLIADGFGYLTSQNNIYKINLINGNIIWKFSAPGGITNLSHNNGTLYFASLDKSFNAIDIKKLDKLSKIKRQFGTNKKIPKYFQSVDRAMTIGLGGKKAPQINKFSEVTFFENKAYFTITNETAKQATFNELDLSNGTTKTIAALKAINPTKPFIYKGIAYFNDLPNRGFNETNSSLISVELASGEVDYLKTKESFSNSPFVYNDTIYVAGSEYRVHSFDLTGKHISTFPAHTDKFFSNFIEVDNEVVFLQKDTVTLSAIKNKETLWNFKNFKGISSFSKPFDDFILVGCDYELIYKLDIKTGNIIWKKDYFDDDVYNIQIKENKAFILSEAAYTKWLQAISLNDGKTIWDKNLIHFEGAPFLIDDKICLANYNGFECHSQNNGETVYSYPSKDSFYGFSPSGILLYFIKDKNSEKTTELKAIDIKTNNELWKKVF